MGGGYDQIGRRPRQSENTGKYERDRLGLFGRVVLRVGLVCAEGSLFFNPRSYSGSYGR